MAAWIATAENHSPSWPGLSQPSMSCFAAKTAMPGTKAGHDEYAGFLSTKIGTS
jgi:hypothetical protein